MVMKIKGVLAHIQNHNNICSLDGNNFASKLPIRAVLLHESICYKMQILWLPAHFFLREEKVKSLMHILSYNFHEIF